METSPPLGDLQRASRIQTSEGARRLEVNAVAGSGGFTGSWLRDVPAKSSPGP